MVPVLSPVVLHNLLLAESIDAEVGIQKEPQIWRQTISYIRNIFNLTAVGWYPQSPCLFKSQVYVPMPISGHDLGFCQRFR